MAAPPPELTNDAVSEILIRLAPDDPASLVRASLVCKPWRRILSDLTFPRRHRDFHGTPTLLGFLRGFPSRDDAASSQFVPVAARAAPFLVPAFGTLSLPLDFRHGRVLFDVEGGTSSGTRLAVWDPVTGGHELLPSPGGGCFSRSGAVLCAAPGCDHRACRHGGPFRVVFVQNTSAVASAWVYSSEAAAWSAPASVRIGGRRSSVERKRGALVGDQLFFLLNNVNMAKAILKFDLRSHCLTVIASPSPVAYGEPLVLMSLDDGSLGLAGVKGSALCLWSRKVNPEGVATWAQYRVIELEKQIPNCKLSYPVRAIGFAEGVGVLLLGQCTSAFTFELKSEQVKEVRTRGYLYYHEVVPYTSFYVPDFTSSKLQFPEETN